MEDNVRPHKVVIADNYLKQYLFPHFGLVFILMEDNVHPHKAVIVDDYVKQYMFSHFTAACLIFGSECMLN